MIEGTVSRTALKIARMALYFDLHPDFRALMPEGLAETNKKVLVALDEYKAWHGRVYASSAFSWLVDVTDRMLGPGYLIHFPLRKRFMDDQVREGQEQGCTQLLVLGAGLDSLALRWAPKGLLCAELDHPSTGVAKQEATRLAGLQSDTLLQVQVDLAQRTVLQALESSIWDTSAPTVIVAEGLLMYLPPPAVEALFRGVAEAVGPGSRFAFSWLPQDEEGRVLLDRVTRWGVAAAGEPVNWSSKPSDVGPMLLANGWSLSPDIDVRARYLDGTPLEGMATTSTERFSVAVRLP